MTFKKTLALILVSFVASAINGQVNFWTKINESQVGAAAFTRERVPSRFNAFVLDEANLRAFLLTTPSRSTTRAENSASIIYMPNTSGGFNRFRIVESNVLKVNMALQNPSIKTYSGIGIDDPYATIGFSITTAGFEGIILSNNQTILIEKPGINSNNYVIYEKNEAGKASFHCHTEALPSPAQQKLPSVNDGKLREYNIVLTCTGEFSQAVLAGGVYLNDTERRAAVRGRFVSILMKINEIYKRELSVQLYLYGDTIFLDASTDPWSIVDVTTQSITQSLFNSKFGNANYSLGHLLHKTASNGDGDAGGIGVVCNATDKGKAYSAYYQPLSSLFETDFIAHEIGHQFGAYHTFSYQLDGVINTLDQCEPGKGTTIMGYAGLDGIIAADVQAHSDDYFHGYSINRISGFLTFTDCDSVTNSSNLAPVANAGADYTIPPFTPFMLQGSATDGNGDLLNYCWEQSNAIQGARNAPSETDVFGPTFRSQKPSTVNYRYMPSLDSILYNKNKSKWEVLSAVSRNLNFRLTVRDINSSGSNNALDENIITVDASYDTFKVTFPNTPVVWRPGETKTITWKTGTTITPPISCTHVAIDYSTDGGYTFSTLLASTDNDGSQDITVPDTSTHSGRIRIRALGNIFFDISDSNFVIKDSLCLKIYRMDSVPVFTSNLFTTIGVGKQGWIWAGTSLSGLYKLKDTVWQRYSSLTNNTFNDIKTDRDGGIWIAQSGNTGAQSLTGAIHNFADTSWNQTTYNVTNGGSVPSRTVRSLFIDTNRYNGPTFLPVVWSAHGSQITGGVSASGGVGRGLNPTTPYFNTYRTGLETANGLGTCNAMGGDSAEVWTFAPNNFGKSQILRYKSNTQFIGAYDSTNVSNTVLNSNFQVRAIYFDKRKYKWVGLASNGVVVRDSTKWVRINFPSMFPPFTAVSANAITGDSTGKVYIGTTNGLIVYEGGPVDSIKSYKLYNSIDGLPSNIIRGIAIDTFRHTIDIATANGIAIWDPFCTGMAVGDATTIGPGNWNDPSIWSNGQIPGPNTIARVMHSVTINVNASCKRLDISGAGHVTVSSGVILSVLKSP